MKRGLAVKSILTGRLDIIMGSAKLVVGSASVLGHRHDRSHRSCGLDNHGLDSRVLIPYLIPAILSSLHMASQKCLCVSISLLLGSTLFRISGESGHEVLSAASPRLSGS